MWMVFQTIFADVMLTSMDARAIKVKVCVRWQTPVSMVACASTRYAERHVLALRVSIHRRFSYFHYYFNNY